MASRDQLLSIGAGRRVLAMLLAFVVAILLLLLMLGFGPQIGPRVKDDYISVVSLEADGTSAEAPAPAPSATVEQADSVAPSPQQPEAAVLPPRAPAPPIVLPAPESTAAPTIPAPGPEAPAKPRIGVRISPGANYGPANVGGGGASGDSERVGTAPNGEPLYAAAWYREPSDSELRGYLATASGPGWALIACRTAPDYRVEDCVGLDEHPAGSQIMRAVLGAAWQFRVRPPRIGGRLQVGSWVRIRIDYGVRPR